MIYRFFVLVLISLSGVNFVEAAGITAFSDTISDSATSVSVNHTIEFTINDSIPASGKIVITPQAGAFAIPSILDFTDIDLLVDDSQKSLASSAGSGSGSVLGVSVITGTSGNIMITLNNIDSISASSSIIIKIGDQKIQNPSVTGSYRINAKTQNSSNVDINTGETRIAIIAPVSVIAGLAVAAPAPVLAEGVFRDESSIVNAMAQTLRTIQERITVLGAEVVVRSCPVIFTHNLFRGNKEEDVRRLQKYLNSQGFLLAKFGPGSPGEETNYFGPLTYAALIKFQETYKEEILRPWGLTRGTGFFGITTRAFILIRCFKDLLPA